MYSANNSSSLQSSSGGADVEEFDSRTFFATATTNNTSVTNTNSSRSSGSNNHLHFFDSLSFLDPSSSFPLLTPIPDPPAKTPAPAPKNSKKRSRASRRTPTTVLTTDTSNFRAMVQEFTGIPAPPFSSTTSSALSSSYPRSRFDFFNPTMNAAAAAAAAAASSSPSFLLKPYPHKFPLPSNNINASSPTNRMIVGGSSNNNSNTVTASPTSFSYLAGTQTPILNFQSLLQSQLAVSSTADLGVKAQQQPMMMPSTSVHAGGAEYRVADLGLPGLIGSGWGQDAGNDPPHNSCKLNFSAAAGPAEFGVEKGAEVRGEGMVESWICSSD